MTPPPRDLELEAAIEKDPDNLEAYLVYADWLQAQGDPRGELMALQCAAYRAPPARAWEFEGPASTLLGQHEQEMLGGLGGLQHRLRWRWGFIEELRLPGKVTTREGHELSPREFLRFFLALPVARFLRGLDVEWADKKNPLFRQLLDALDERVCPTVERLSLGHLTRFKHVSSQGLWRLGELRLSHRCLPRLRSLTLCGRVERLDRVDLPELRQLHLLSGSSLESLAGCLVAAHMPGLERLVLEGHGDGMNSVREGQELRPLLELQGLSHLKHLGLRWIIGSNAARGRELCRTLARSGLLRQLESLDLSRGAMTDEVAEVLLEHAAAFRHLRHLDVSSHFLSPEAAARVATLCGSVEVSGQNGAEDGREE